MCMAAGESPVTKYFCILCVKYFLPNDELFLVAFTKDKGGVTLVR